MAPATETAVTSIGESFRSVAAGTPEVVALTSARDRYTYAHLDRWSDAIAAHLLAQNAPLDRPVAIILRDPVALVPALLGTLKAGHFFVVIDAGDPAERISSILTASGASLALTDADVSSLANRASSARPPSRAPHELVQLVFTSGTTGAPKAIAVRQRSFVERAVARAGVTGRSAGARVSSTALPGFARASTEILGTLLNGGTLCAFDARSEPLDALAAFIERERISILTLTPALFRRFLKVAPPGLDLSSVRKLRIGADVMTVADVEAFKARFPRTCTLERSFNATETGPVTHMTIDHDTPVPGPLVPIGRPRPGVELRLVDDRGNDVPIGEPGEMIVRGPAVADGYWNAPELTAEKFVLGPDGVNAFYTGDLVKQDGEGLYYFVGRKDSRLKIHGRRVDPLEIESALVLHAGVREAVVVGQPAADGELRLAAYVVMPPGAAFAPRAIRTALRAQLPASMIPSRLHAIDAIPMSGSGKVDRESLAQRVEPEVSGGDEQPRDAIERTLLEIWSRTTAQPVGLDDDFFDDLGGESVVAAHLVAEVRRVMGRGLPLSLLLELNTVAKMADYLRTRADMDRIAVVVQRGASQTPLFCVSGKGGSVIVFRRLAELLGSEQTVIGLTHEGFAAETFPKTFAAMAACYADAIRAKQPAGPYFLAGYSAGGKVALDVARQLAAAGEEVAFVGLIDTALRTEPAALRSRTLHRIALLCRRPRVYAPRYLRAIGRRLLRVVTLGRVRSLDRDLARLQQLTDAYLSVLKRDALRPFPGPITLFAAECGLGRDHASLAEDWAPFCRGVDVVPIDGEHLTVLREDVASLAAAMRTALDRAAESNAARKSEAQSPLPAAAGRPAQPAADRR